MSLSKENVFNDIKNGIVFYNENKPLIGIRKNDKRYMLDSRINNKTSTIGWFETISDANSFLLENVGKIGKLRVNTPVIESEEWRSIPSINNNYMVSSHGRVISMFKDRLRLMRQYLSNSGYYSINFSSNDSMISRTVHSLVAEVFLGHIPDKTLSLVVDHIDNNKLNNNVNNLQIITQRDNAIRSKKNHKKYSKHCNCNTFFSRIFIDGKNTYLGSFKTPDEAIKAYDDAYEKLLNNSKT